MAVLPKHLRPRWRYLAVVLECWGERTITRRDFQGTLWREARSLVGDIGSAAVSLDVVRFTHEGGRGSAIVRVHRDALTEARAIIATVSHVDDEPISASIRGVSGTIRACEENYLGIAREGTSHEVIALEDVETPAVIRSQAVDVDHDSIRLGATTLDIM